MATKYYGINDKWTDDDLENVIEVASEDGTISSVKVNGVEYGGGGGLSTYTLNITNNNLLGIVFKGVYVDDDGYLSYERSIFPEGGTAELSILVNDEGTSELQLLFGNEDAIPDDKITLSGCTYEEGFITMNGDATITVSN